MCCSVVIKLAKEQVILTYPPSLSRLTTPKKYNPVLGSRREVDKFRESVAEPTHCKNRHPFMSSYAKLESDGLHT